ncbi:MAG: 3'-phosphoesterase [Candidatus Altiarchaeota archaeon]|nr:3'-phosphoesterase [Candidatus Altiarchaeota archaeon]
MPLNEYKKKRDFSKTKEPSGKVKESGESKIFVVQKHKARNLHYDLRLETGGVLKSWAVPKEPPLKEGVKRLAVETEDHPIEYANFEGGIPEGEYGAGTVEIWDKGSFIPEKTQEKEILFTLNGKRMKGKYVLVKLKPTERFPGEKNWLLYKKKE